MAFHRRSATTVTWLLFSVVSRITVVFVPFVWVFYLKPCLFFLTAMIGSCLILDVGFVDDEEMVPAIKKLDFWNAEVFFIPDDNVSIVNVSCRLAFLLLECKRSRIISSSNVHNSDLAASEAIDARNASNVSTALLALLNNLYLPKVTFFYFLEWTFCHFSNISKRQFWCFHLRILLQESFLSFCS